MDLSEVTDIKELKALAYDEMAKKQVAERNLSLINQRLVELSQPEDSQAASRTKTAKK